MAKKSRISNVRRSSVRHSTLTRKAKTVVEFNLNVQSTSTPNLEKGKNETRNEPIHQEVDVDEEMTEKPEPIRKGLGKQNGDRDSDMKSEPTVAATTTRVTRASRAFARKESVVAEAPISEIPKEKTRKRSSKSIEQAENVEVADENERRSNRSKGKPKPIEAEPALHSDDEEDDDVVATPPPSKVSKMAETERPASEAKTASKPRQRFAPSKLESDREENLKHQQQHHPTTTASTAQYSFPNRAAFSGGIGSGSSSSSHFKHK